MSQVTRSSLQKLAAKWRVIGLFLVAFAQLEICVRAAHIMILQDIEEAAGAASPETEADDYALGFLRAVSGYLLAIGLVLQNILARGVLEVSVWMRARAAYRGWFPEFLQDTQGRALVRLDPG